ncbi:MAG TPA: hypothetical protein VHG93_05490, partial [Longimicrobium sp.]|nr:hypothetical protein [Longimicrobium sp.]
MPLTPPTINQVAWRPPHDSFPASWEVDFEEPGDAPGDAVFMAALFDREGNPLGEPVAADGTSAWIDVPSTLRPEQYVVVKMATRSGGAAGAWSAPVPALFVAPAGLAVEWDGTAVTARWANPPAGAVPAQGQVLLSWGPATGVTFLASGTAARFVPDVAIDPERAYTVSVTPVLGNGSGPPSASVPLLQAPAPVGLLRPVHETTVQVGMPAASGAAPSSLVVGLSVDGAPRAPVALPADAVSWGGRTYYAAHYPLRAAVAPGAAYRFSLRQVQGMSTGPASAAALPSVPVEIESATVVPDAGATGVTVTLAGGTEAGAWVTVRDAAGAVAGEGFVPGRGGKVAT